MTRGRPLTPMIVVPDDLCGPAMAALSPPMRAFVLAYVHFGCNRAEAARRAGYSKDKSHNAKVTAYSLWRREDVQAAILEESRKVLRDEGPRSIKTLVDIRDDKKSDAKDRLKAAMTLLDRAGLHAVTQHQVEVTHRNLTEEQKDRRILDLCRELGIADTEARKLLVAPEVIDAEFTEVRPEEPAGPPTQEDAKRERENDLRRQRRHMSPDELAAHKQEKREQRRAEAKVRFAEANAASANEAPMSSEGIEDLLAG